MESPEHYFFWNCKKPLPSLQIFLTTLPKKTRRKHLSFVQLNHVLYSCNYPSIATNPKHVLFPWLFWDHLSITCFRLPSLFPIYLDCCPQTWLRKANHSYFDHHYFCKYIGATSLVEFFWTFRSFNSLSLPLWRRIEDKLKASI